MKPGCNTVYHLHRCPPHRHPPRRCGQCLFGQGYAHRGSCRSGRPPHPCRNQTAGGYIGGRSCPVVERFCMSGSRSSGMTKQHKCTCPTVSSGIPSLSSSLSQASPWPSLSKSSCPELGRLGQLSWNKNRMFMDPSGILQANVRLLLLLPSCSGRLH